MRSKGWTSNWWKDKRYCLLGKLRLEKSHGVISEKPTKHSKRRCHVWAYKTRSTIAVYDDSSCQPLKPEIGRHFPSLFRPGLVLEGWNTVPCWYGCSWQVMILSLFPPSLPPFLPISLSANFPIWNNAKLNEGRNELSTAQNFDHTALDILTTTTRFLMWKDS